MHVRQCVHVSACFTLLLFPFNNIAPWPFFCSVLLLIIWNWGDPQPSTECHELVCVYFLSVIPELSHDNNCRSRDPFFLFKAFKGPQGTGVAWGGGSGRRNGKVCSTEALTAGWKLILASHSPEAEPGKVFHSCNSQGAYFEGDWDVIVLCTMFPASFIFFNKFLYFNLSFSLKKILLFNYSCPHFSSIALPALPTPHHI